MLEGINFSVLFGYMVGGYDVVYYGYFWSEVKSQYFYIILIFGYEFRIGIFKLF